MTTVRQATRRHAATARRAAASKPAGDREAPGPTGEPAGHTRLSRRRRQRRLVREELAAVLVLAVILTVVLVMLGLQWLDTGSTIQSSIGHDSLTHLNRSPHA